MDKKECKESVLFVYLLQIRSMTSTALRRFEMKIYFHGIVEKFFQPKGVILFLVDDVYLNDEPVPLALISELMW